VRPGGHFLYADNRTGAHISAWEAAIADAPMQLVSERVINAEVLRGMDGRSQRSTELIDRRLPSFLRFWGRNFAGVQGSPFYRNLQQGKSSYRMYCFAKV
jgi:hypothetical protein